MKPVTGGTDPRLKQSDKSDKNNPKQEGKKSGKVRRDIDSSDEIRSEEDLGESGKNAPKMRSKQPPKNKEKEVHVAPNSTTYGPLPIADPSFRSSSKREAFQGRVKREKEVGKQHLHRRCETDLKENFLELESLKSAQRKKELVDKSKAAGGHLKVALKNRKDVDLLVAVLNENPSIRSLDLVCDSGGKSTNPADMTRSQRHLMVVPQEEVTVQSAWPDTDSFRSILDACKNVEALNLKECFLTEKDWYSLAGQLRGTSKIRRLEFGGKTEISESGLERISSAIASRDSSLRELVIDDLSMDQFSFDKLSKAIKKHGNFSLIKLQNICAKALIGDFADIDLMFDICTSNPKLQHFSLAGTMFKQFTPANDVVFMQNFGMPEVSANALNFRKHTCLRIFDLSGCGLDQADMGEIAAACDGHTALIEVRIEGNKISDSDLAKLKATTTLNRQRLEAQATIAYDLLVTHASEKVDVWPKELSSVLVENTPIEILPNIAAVVAPGSGPSAQPSATANIRNPKNSTRWSTTDKLSKNQ